MNKKEREKILTKNLKIVYDEYSAYVYHLLALKPFFQDMIETSVGKTPKFDLSEMVKSKEN